MEVFSQIGVIRPARVGVGRKVGYIDSTCSDARIAIVVGYRKRDCKYAKLRISVSWRDICIRSREIDPLVEWLAIEKTVEVPRILINA